MPCSVYKGENMSEMKAPVCYACDTELQLKKRAILQLTDAENLLMSAEMMYADIYVCPQCRRMEFFSPLSPAEKLDQIPKEGVERYEYNFKDYTEKQLQKVIEGKGYVDEAKRAAKRLLAKRRGYGE